MVAAPGERALSHMTLLWLHHRAGAMLDVWSFTCDAVNPLLLTHTDGVMMMINGAFYQDVIYEIFN